jgi:acyl carrier protein
MSITPEVPTRVREIVAEYSGAVLDAVQPETKLSALLDSLELIEAGFELEKAFRITIEDEDLEAVVTVQDLITLCDRLIAAQVA